ncbi:hypothetical protein KBD20_01145 [Candidatus Saccharibacteria bacterium]|nr:hypothetical protein [Candidatus Saccharibacteria bacterium]
MDSSLIALLFIATGLVGMLAFVTHFTKPKMNKHHFEKKWASIIAEENTTMSVIKADSLVDEALRHAGIKGGTMGERLNNSTGILRDTNGVWDAHKLRNKVVHQTDTVVSPSEQQRALRHFKKALKDIGAL